jgi:conjugative transposon TraM protein
METKSPKFLKQRKFFMVLPLLVIPFLTIIFVALGGGKGNSSQAETINTGLNLKLPDAHFKKGKEKDKLGSYEESNKDSVRIHEAMKNDPYYKKQNRLADSPFTNQLQSIMQRAAIENNQQALTSTLPNTGINPNEKKVMDKLALLKTALSKKQEQIQPGYTNSNSPDIERLQMMMQNMQQNNSRQSEPEINQIDKVLEKLMVVQHPEMLQDSMKNLTLKNKPESFAVTLNDTSEQQGFYGLSDDIETNHSNAIEAAVDETQTLVSGAVIKLRLLQNIYVHGSLIAKDQLIYGISSLNNERLKISISSVRSNDNILPVSLEVFDMDGLAGIYIPGSINRDVSKASADEAISSLGITSLDPSLGAQAANAGIQAAKTLISKKVKLIRVSVKAGYKVLLKDLNQK